MNDLEEIIRQISNEIRPYGNTRERIGKAFLLLNKAKVDKEQGKGLSTNDFTTELKQKLEDLENNYLQKGTYQGTASDLKHQIENLTIGGRNLLCGTQDFVIKDVPNCLSTLRMGSGEIINERFNSNAVRRITKAWQGFKADIPNIVNEPVIISFWAKTNTEGSSFNVYSFKNNDPNNIRRFIEISNNGNLIADNQWHRYTIFNPRGMNFGLGIQNGFIEFNQFRGDIFVSSIKIEKGNKPTDWTPAPEDVFIQQATSLLKTSASIRTSQDIGGFSQNGRTIVTQGTANIIVTIDSQDGFVATYQKAGTGNVTFVSTGGKNLILVDRENAIIGDKGSTATITIVENEILLRVHNV